MANGSSSRHPNGHVRIGKREAVAPGASERHSFDAPANSAGFAWIELLTEGTTVPEHVRIEEQPRTEVEITSARLFPDGDEADDDEESYARSFQRPSFEVDRRINTESWTTRADATLDFTQRTGIRAAATRQELDVPRGQDFFGTDLGKTLSRDVNRAVLGFLYHVTPKTSLVLEGLRIANENNWFARFDDVVSPIRYC